MVKDTASANDRALAKFDLRHPRTILDIGFGQGRTASVLVRDGHTVLGVDASPTMIRQATARNRAAVRDGRATLRRGDGVTIPFPDESADAAITVHTIYFMADPAATLADIARVLRADGRLVVACRTSDDSTPAWMDPNVYRIPSATQVVTMLQDAGFGDIEHEPGDRSQCAVHYFVGRLVS
jgi:ubiquinone/menaquinone biosynthesis C-methylase UbiE